MEVFERPVEIAETREDRFSRQARDSRQLVPELGYRNYWYPAILSSKLKRRPVYRKLLGDEIVLWRHAQTGVPYALAAWCPHRGAPLWRGKQHFAGTLSCPYHGWTFDGQGVCRAVLSEGPESPIPGRTKTRSYPTQERVGLIWIWMGDMDPVPLEEDVPEELLDSEVRLYMKEEVWHCNWRPTMDNPGDSHPVYLHRTSLHSLFDRMPGWERKEIKTDERSVGMKRVKQGEKAEYPGLGIYPARTWWRVRKSTRRRAGKSPYTSQLVLPCWIRVDMSRYMYTRFAVPVDANTTLNFQVAARRCTNGWQRLCYAIYSRTWVKLMFFGTFSGQDKWLLELLNYKQPESLSVTDAGLVQWRRLASRARGAGSPGQSD